MKARYGVILLGALALGGVAVVVREAYAQDKDAVKSITALLKKGDMAGAKKAAADFAKKGDDASELMHLFGKKGLGVAGGTLGIEATLVKLSNNPPTAAALGTMAEGYTEMGYHVAAIGLYTAALAPAKDKGKQTRKAWIEWSDSMVESGMKLAEVSKAKNAAEIKTQAAKVNASCNSCHMVFRN